MSQDKKIDVLEHLDSRNFEINKHRAWINQEESCVTFPLHDGSGFMNGYQVYRPLGGKTKSNDPREGRYFSRTRKGTVSLWGNGLFEKTPLFVCEGIFDAARLSKLGFASVAVLSYDVNKETKQLFRFLRQIRKMISVCDSGKDGRKLGKLSHHSFTCQSDFSDADDKEVELFKEWCLTIQ